MFSPERQLPRFLAALVAALAVAVPSALADGDPASDYLVSEPMYLSPFDGHVSKAQADMLGELLAEAKKEGFSLKVAVIVTRYDLGSVPVLFLKPQRYADFLGAEVFYYIKDELLIVMPNGYGISKAGKGYGTVKAGGVPAGDRAAIAALPALNTTNGDELVAAAAQAVRALAARRGIKLPAASGQSAGSGGNRDRAEIAAAVVVAGLLALALRLAWRRRGAVR